MSPRTALQFEEIREEKKTLIMNVALEHFSEVGFHATTINHIARHAGISKGLMYNYFKSKEELLSEIVIRSANEIYQSFDPDHDGQLSEDEFEFFIRKVFSILKEKRQFWRLITGIMLQRGVYERILNEGMGKAIHGGTSFKEFSENMSMQIAGYFKNKDNSKSEKDAMIDMLMFINTIKGFAITMLFAEEMYPDDLYEKTIDAIIMKYR